MWRFWKTFVVRRCVIWLSTTLWQLFEYICSPHFYILLKLDDICPSFAVLRYPKMSLQERQLGVQNNDSERLIFRPGCPRLNYVVPKLIRMHFWSSNSNFLSCRISNAIFNFRFTDSSNKFFFRSFWFQVSNVARKNYF